MARKGSRDPRCEEQFCASKYVCKENLSIYFHAAVWTIHGDAAVVLFLMSFFKSLLGNNFHEGLKKKRRIFTTSLFRCQVPFYRNWKGKKREETQDLNDTRYKRHIRVQNIHTRGVLVCYLFHIKAIIDDGNALISVTAARDLCVIYYKVFIFLWRSADESLRRKVLKTGLFVCSLPERLPWNEASSVGSSCFVL